VWKLICLLVSSNNANHGPDVYMKEQHRPGMKRDKQCTYKLTLALSRNHCCNGNATMRYTCIVEPHVTLSKKYIACCTKMLLWRIYFADKNKTYFVLHVKFPTFLSDYNKFGAFLRIFIKAPSIKFHGNPSNGSRADTFGQTDGHEANRRFSRLCKRA
jgi:hypothetical protein